MVFVEFLEFVGRLGNQLFKGDDMELYEKIDKIMDWLLALIGIQRRLPNIVEFIYSESD